MSDVVEFRYVAAALFAIPGLIFAIMARQLWEYRRIAHSSSHLIRVAPIVTTVLTLDILTHVLAALLPPEASASLTAHVVTALLDTTGFASLAVCRHVLRVIPIPERPPSAGWHALNYGVTAVAAVVVFVARAVPGVPAFWEHAMHVGGHAYLGVLSVLCIVELLRVARPSAWGPDAAGELRRPDLVLMLGLVAVTVTTAGLLAALGATGAARVILEVGTIIAVAAPFVLRMLSVVVIELVVAIATLVALALVFVAHAALTRALDPALAPLAHAAMLAAAGLVVIPGQAWLRATTERALFRRSRQQQLELLAFLDTLSPELGATECCRRALAELVRLRKVTGAAIILRDGEALVHGEFAIEPLRRVWPRGDAIDALPDRAFGTAELRELPLALREALIRANVGLGAAPILSPRRRWGHFFMATGLFGGTLRIDDADAFRAFVAQLALLLDGTELLARAVAGERSAAHAEKLAAVGELAARIAHEIRNPVTAARSLAQQLAREPGTTGAAELGLILGELERVERQVAALLRFARRDEFVFEPVDLGALVRGTIEAFRSRLEAAHVGVELDLAPAIVAPADREKLRQVLVNLVENALDALGETPVPRRLALAVARENGAAHLRVADSGPGVPADALPHLFEPFYSRKATGTGLGLAIAKRTVDAHGGRIAAASPPGAGFTVDIELPAPSRP